MSALQFGLKPFVLVVQRPELVAVVEIRGQELDVVTGCD